VSATIATGALERRLAAGERYFGERAEAIALLCRELAERFAGGGRLLVAGASAAARSDVRHVAVEFVHPVIVGKRALPALAVEPAALALLARPQDIVMGFGADLSEAAARGCLTVDFGMPDPDPFVAQELVETHYHLLWELVHVFLEHRDARNRDPGAAGFLYPFLESGGQDPEALLEDVRRSVLLKAAEVRELRTQTLGADAPAVAAAAAALRERLARGGKVLALGNGGSATDAMDLVADLREPPAGRDLRPRPAIDLTEDPAILTAIANDVGYESVFARQVIAYGEPSDALVAISTSGGSANVIAALAQARSRGLLTIALVGYDGGRVASEGLADHVLITRCEHIPRIQEAQAGVLHVLRELIEQ
jgi:D-sedoheptulose 7-phosphate isomerase